MICPSCQKVFTSNDELVSHLLRVERWQESELQRLLNVGLLTIEELSESLSKVKNSNS